MHEYICLDSKRRKAWQLCWMSVPRDSGRKSTVAETVSDQRQMDLQAKTTSRIWLRASREKVRIWSRRVKDASCKIVIIFNQKTTLSPLLVSTTLQI